MLKEENLDRFLDAFLDNSSAQSVDTDFWDDDGTVIVQEAAEVWDSQAVWVMPEKKGRLSGRTIVSIFLIVLLIPLTICAGLVFFDDRKYQVISLAIAVYSVIPFFMVFEGRKPQARELLTISVLVAIAVAGRAAFFMLANFKPVAAITILAGVSFGAESGFMVGALSMLVSNMLMGQGPWTPWQMFAMGLIGFFAGLFFQKGWLRARRISLCLYGFLSVFLLYGGIMNPATLVMFSSAITPQGLLAVYISGVPMDLVHAASTVFFLWIAGKPMLEKLERIKVKYGLL